MLTNLFNITYQSIKKLTLDYSYMRTYANQLNKLRHQLKGTNMNKADKQRVASLINTLEVARICIADESCTKDLEVIWRRDIKKVTLELGDLFGIELPAYEDYKWSNNMNTWTQHIEKAVVCYGPNCRLYVPYKGNLTGAKNQELREAVKAYCHHQNIEHLTYGWKTKDITIKHTEGVLSTYSEEGASGRTKVYVCPINFHKANQ